MKLLKLVTPIVIIASLMGCKKEETPFIDNPDVHSVQIDSVLKSFYPKPTPSSTFEGIYLWNFLQPPINLDCAFFINFYWYDPAVKHGIYLHFNNSVGDVLLDDNGFIKGFNSGVKIDSTLAGTWSGLNDGVISYDYVANPAAEKGNLAGKGDKYIVFSAHDNNPATSHFKYYGWMRVRVSENGREMKILSIGFQKNPNTALYTGEL